VGKGWERRGEGEGERGVEEVGEGRRTSDNKLGRGRRGEKGKEKRGRKEKGGLNVEEGEGRRDRDRRKSNRGA